MGLHFVAPLPRLLYGPAQQTVVRHGRKTQHGPHNVVTVGLQATGHEAVIACQVATAAGECAQFWQQVCIWAAQAGLPVTQCQVGVRRALVRRHAGTRCHRGSSASTAGERLLAPHSYTR